MPPVFGPASPSPTRLKSCAGARGTAVVPSHTARIDSSGPVRPSSIDDGAAGVAEGLAREVPVHRVAGLGAATR